jgi:hypothetical protein
MNVREHSAFHPETDCWLATADIHGTHYELSEHDYAAWNRRAAPTPPAVADGAVEVMRNALRRAERFIVNGVELGYIRMPAAGTPDSAHDTLPLIRTALARPAPPAAEAGFTPTHRHYKGGLYQVLMRGVLEGNLMPVVIYRAENGTNWVRSAQEFDDGRFAPLPAPASRR